MLNKLVKDHEEKSARMAKLQKDDRPSKVDSREKKIEDARTQLEAATAQWKQESAALFSGFERIDREQIQNLQRLFKNSFQFQIDSLQLQMMVNNSYRIIALTIGRIYSRP